MKIIHFSDSHLGYFTYKALDAELGINQREADIYSAFKQAIDRIIELKPDLVLHSGDLFDSVRPSNRAIHFAIEQLLRLSRVNIPIVLIAGNHEMPKMRDTDGIFKLFTFFPNIYPVFSGKYKKVALPTKKNSQVIVHAVPQCSTGEEFQKNLKLIQVNSDDDCYNVLMLHAGIQDIAEFSMGEFNEQLVPSNFLKPEFDYIALGHYHKFSRILENTYYVGSTERLSFGEAGEEKGVLEMNLKTKEIKFHSLDIRPMIELPFIDADNLDAETLMKKIEKTIKTSEITQKIVRLSINQISASTYNALDFKSIKVLTSPSLHFEIRYNKKPTISANNSVESFEEKSLLSENLSVPLNLAWGNLPLEFSNYILRIEEDKKYKEKLLELGLNYLKKAIAANESNACLCQHGRQVFLSPLEYSESDKDPGVKQIETGKSPA